MPINARTLQILSTAPSIILVLHLSKKLAELKINPKAKAGKQPPKQRVR